jgi:hypothetical protein
MSVFFRNRIRLYFTFSRAYEKDWIAISDRLAEWLTSFERPLDAFPQQATHQVWPAAIAASISLR